MRPIWRIGAATLNHFGMTLADALNAGHGVLATSAHRPLRNQIRRAIDRGDLVRLLPGVVVLRELAADPVARARAAVLWQPRGILLRRIAARLSFWPDCRVDAIDLNMAHTRHCPGFIKASQQRIPADHLLPWGPAHLTSPSITVLDLARVGDWAALCEALRTGAVTLASLTEANDALAGHPGATRRRECLVRAAANPWSVPEMDLHQLYRENGIAGWVGNARLRVGQTTMIPDVRFDRERLLVEVDSRQHHTQAESFERDRARHNLVTVNDWAVLTFTPSSIWTTPGLVVAQTRALLQQRRP